MNNIPFSLNSENKKLSTIHESHGNINNDAKKFYSALYEAVKLVYKI